VDAFYAYAQFHDVAPCPGIGHVSSSLSAASMTTPVVMTNNTLKQITDLLEKRPLGQYLDFQHSPPTPVVRAAVEMASKLRLVCFPNQGFSKCALFRGCSPAVLQTHTTAAEGDGYVVMWQHGRGGTIRISSVAWSDFWKDDFDNTKWDIVIGAIEKRLRRIRQHHQPTS
jgi:hypothetical protein